MMLFEFLTPVQKLRNFQFFTYSTHDEMFPSNFLLVLNSLVDDFFAHTDGVE